MHLLTRSIGTFLRRLRGVREEWIPIPKDLWEHWPIAPEVLASLGLGFADDSEFALHYFSGWSWGFQLQVFPDGLVRLDTQEDGKELREYWTRRYQSHIRPTKVAELRQIEGTLQRNAAAEAFKWDGDDLPVGTLRFRTTIREWKIRMEPYREYLRTPEFVGVRLLWNALIDCAPIRYVRHWKV